MTMSPATHSLVSRTKKSILGVPIPMLIIVIGVPQYLPVIVRKPRSDRAVNGVGEASRKDAMVRAREGDPTVTILLATWPGLRPR